MSEKLIVHKVPDKVQKQSIEILKVRKETLEYLRNNGFQTILDVIERQNEIPSQYRETYMLISFLELRGK